MVNCLRAWLRLQTSCTLEPRKGDGRQSVAVRRNHERGTLEPPSLSISASALNSSARAHTHGGIRRAEFLNIEILSYLQTTRSEFSSSSFGLLS